MDEATRALGPYEILELKGQGGMGAVYLARHRRLKRLVALKVLRPSYVLDPRVLARFQREAQVAAAVSHPALVEVYDFGRDGEMDYIAMEWVDGPTLKDVMAAGPMDPERTLVLGIEVLEGLAACHAAGVLHRDLKPANLMLDAQGRLRILDFGLVMQEGRTALTRTGDMIGTPRYMPPEILCGEAFDVRSDLYQVGTVLHECLLGEPLWRCDNVDVLVTAILHDPLPALPDCGPATAAITTALEKLTARDREARFPDTSAAVAALRQSLGALRMAGRTAARRRGGAPSGASGVLPSVEDQAAGDAGPPQRWGGALAATAMVGLALIAGLALVVWRGPRLRPERPLAGASGVQGEALARYRDPDRPPWAIPALTEAPSPAADRERASPPELTERALRWLTQVVQPRRWREQVEARRLMTWPGNPPSRELLEHLESLRVTVDTPAYRTLREELTGSASLLATSTEVPPDQRANLLRRASQLEDLHVFITDVLKLEPGWQPLPVPGAAPRPRAPPAARPFFALAFGAPNAAVPGLDLGPPAVFLESDEEQLQLRALTIRDKAVVTHPSPVPAGAREVLLAFRLAGGRRDERLLVQTTPDGGWRTGGELAILRGAGRGQRVEGVMSLDRRLLEVPGMQLRISSKYDGPVGAALGITVERFEFLALP